MKESEEISRNFSFVPPPSYNSIPMLAMRAARCVGADGGLKRRVQKHRQRAAKSRRQATQECRWRSRSRVVCQEDKRIRNLGVYLLCGRVRMHMQANIHLITLSLGWCSCMRRGSSRASPCAGCVRRYECEHFLGNTFTTLRLASQIFDVFEHDFTG